MPRKPVPISHVCPYHVSARSNNLEWFQLPPIECLKIFEECLILTKRNFGVLIHEFVLMSNHYHMLITAPKESISASMRYFQTETARRFCRATGRKNRIWGQRYHPTLILHTSDYPHLLKYVLRNPVKAGMASKIEDYQFTARNLPDRPVGQILEKPSKEFGEILEMTKPDFNLWLNTATPKEFDQMLGAGLRKRKFSLPRNPRTKRRTGWRGSGIKQSHI